MKTKELIRRLQNADPTGELECCVGNIDIYYVDVLPPYYDGAQEILVHDNIKRDNEWSIIGGKIVRIGEYKVQINTMSIEDAMMDAIIDGKEFPIEIIGDSTDGYYQKKIERWKEDAIKIKNELKENTSKNKEEYLEQKNI